MKPTFLFAVLFAAGGLLAAELPIDGTFENSVLHSKTPRHWGLLQSKAPGAAVTEVITAEDGGTAFAITTQKKRAMFYHDPAVDVKEGETLKITFTVSGKGKMYVGYFGHNGAKYLNTVYNKCFEINGKAQLTDSIPIRPKVNRIKPSFWVMENSSLVLHSIKMETLPPSAGK